MKISDLLSQSTERFRRHQSDRGVPRNPCPSGQGQGVQYNENTVPESSALQGGELYNPRFQAELLLAKALKMSREALYANLDADFPEKVRETLEELVQRRLAGEPLQYLLGHQEFWSIDLKVDSRALIPRPDTELLVEQSLSVLFKETGERSPWILEIGTGSGAIAIALAKEIRKSRLVATDISYEALALARENSKSTGVQKQIEFINGDLFGALKGKRPFDLIVSNPPYIVRSEIRSLAKEVREHEPSLALDGGEDGLDFYKQIISQSPLYLRARGWLLLEIGQGQGEKVTEALEQSEMFLSPQLFKDLAGIERVVKAQKR